MPLKHECKSDELRLDVYMIGMIRTHSSQLVQSLEALAFEEQV